MVANGEPLPDDASIILYVKRTAQLPKGVAECDSLDIDAFRCDDDGISVTWVEYFPGSDAEQLLSAAFALKGALSFKKSGLLARATVADLKATMKAANRTVKVVRDVMPDNDAHCLVQGIAADESGMLLTLVNAFPAVSFVSCGSIPGLI